MQYQVIKNSCMALGLWPAHHKQGVNSYAGSPSEEVSGREYHVPPRVTLRCTSGRRWRGLGAHRLPKFKTDKSGISSRVRFKVEFIIGLPDLS